MESLAQNVGAFKPKQFLLNLYDDIVYQCTFWPWEVS
jgi:hypothetical protein